MLATSNHLNEVLDKYHPLLKSVSETDYGAKASPEKWSKREILGHLIDSAQSNLRRFIVAQYEDNPQILYKQNEWVKLNAYQEAETSFILAHWLLVNKQIVRVLANMDPSSQKRLCTTGEAHTLEWLAADYVKHLLHHLHAILEMDPIPYP